MSKWEYIILMNIFVWVFSSEQKLTISLCSQRAAPLGGNPLTSHVAPGKDISWIAGSSSSSCKWGGQSRTCCLRLQSIRQQSECSLWARHHSAHIHALKTLYILHTHTHTHTHICLIYVFPGGSVVKNPPANAGDAGDMGSTPGSRRSPGRGHGHPLQYSGLENPMDRGAWRATVHGVIKSRTWLSS